MSKLLIGTIAAATMALTANAASAEPAPAPAASPTPAPSHYTTTDTMIGDLLADPAAKAVVDKHIPGLSDNASIGMASGMTLRVIQPMAADQISEEKLDGIDADLAKLPAK